MKVLVFVKATPNSEQGLFPPDADKMFAEMGKFNEQLVKAGTMQDADGLKPSSAGKRIKFTDGGTPSVIDGPFAETKELVAGYWIWNVKSKQEAIDWVRRCPNPHDGDSEIEIRQIFEEADFADVSTPELQAAEARLREQLSKK